LLLEWQMWRIQIQLVPVNINFKKEKMLVDVSVNYECLETLACLTLYNVYVHKHLYVRERGNYEYWASLHLKSITKNNFINPQSD
jgi:hypothetical protein